MATVSFARATKRFGHVEAVRELTLEIADGELMVLVGPSGSGKTTALRMLAGLEAVSSGEVRIGGRVVNHVSPKDRDVAMVFQDYALYPQMRVFDNLAFGLRRRKTPKVEIEARVRRTAEALQLDELLDRRPGQLSGGQQQRVALGRALVRDPQVFLMDEPLSNLDAKLRVQTRGEIKRLQQQLGRTTVYVTHDQVEAMTMGDRIAVLNEGRLEQVGTPELLYERPANLFVAGFIGSPAMSFARVAASRDGDGGVRLRGEGFDLRAPVAGADAPGELILGVRPEHARLWRDGAGLIGPLNGTVAYVEALGRETFLGVDVGPGTRVVVCVEGRASVQLGEGVLFGLAPEGVRMFAADNGHALAGAATGLNSSSRSVR
jgi:ABC-type sugar transport system ATPase subunit